MHFKLECVSIHCKTTCFPHYSSLPCFSRFKVRGKYSGPGIQERSAPAAKPPLPCIAYSSTYTMLPCPHLTLHRVDSRRAERPCGERRAPCCSIHLARCLDLSLYNVALWQSRLLPSNSCGGSSICACPPPGDPSLPPCPASLPPCSRAFSPGAGI